MKNLNSAIAIIIAMIMALAACKKSDLTQAELVGTWIEIQPCVRDSSQCYTLQFANNNMVYVSTPFVDSGNYILMSNNKIQIDNIIVWGPGETGSMTYQVIPDGNEMTIKNFYTPLTWFGNTPAPIYDLHIKKM